MNFIYVISDSIEGPCKVGISGDPNKRLKQLQTGHPNKLQLFYTEQLEDARLYEGLFHKDLNHKRKKGEWFDLTVEDAIAHVQFTLIQYQPSELSVL